MNEAAKIKLSISSHNGAVRNHNEDNFTINGKSRPLNRDIINIHGIIEDDTLLIGVYDGMGGEENGEKASQIAAQMSEELFVKLNGALVERYPDIVNEYVSSANSAICDCLKNNSSSRGGTTIAFVYIKNKVVYPFSLGDSRIYLFFDNDLIQISEDHTLAMRKYKSNIYTLEEAEQSMDSHKLTLFLGVDVNGNGLTAQWYQPFNIPTGCKLLLCSDGLYDMCSKQEIISILSGNSSKYSADLVKTAICNGGIDNITCIVADFS